METLWFCLVTFLIAGYVVLDGFDLGAGIVHLLVAKTEEERGMVLKSIGPFWDGNEVWLLAGGGTLYFAFPALYASSFSGFYLPLMIVLWLLILRGCGIELRHHVEGRTWKPFWDVVFAGASALLAVFFGAALGNVVRGVPLDRQGDFFLPLWTDFQVGHEPGILDWYTILVGVLALLTLATHGALWVAYKTEGGIQRRARRAATAAAPLTALLTVAVTAATFAIQPRVPASFALRPWGHLFPGVAVLSMAALVAFHRRGEELKAFLASCGFIAGMLMSAAFGLYPAVLPSVVDPSLSLTVHNAAAPEYGLRIGLVWWIPGMLLATGYAYFLYRRFAGKVKAGEGHY